MGSWDLDMAPMQRFLFLKIVILINIYFLNCVILQARDVLKAVLGEALKELKRVVLIVQSKPCLFLYIHTVYKKGSELSVA